MGDSLTLDLDITEVARALTELGPFAQPYVNDASHVTAEAMVREMKARLKRQLGPNATGATEAGITASPAYDGNGWVVVSDRAHDLLSWHTMPSGRSHTQAVTQSNVPLWIEKGTKRGKPGSHTSAARPYFYASAQLEEHAHEQRIADALQQAFADRGLGE